MPTLPVAAGEYATEWFLGDRKVAGEVDLRPLLPPKVTMFDDVEETDWSAGGGFPQEHEYERIVGRTRSGLDIVLTDANVAIWFPQRSLGSARHAVVGHDVATVAGDAFSQIEFQFTEADLLFGVAPIKSVSWPGDGTPPLAGQFAMEGNPAANHNWESADGGISIDCRYEVRFSISNGHRHEVAFAPVVAMASPEPLTVDQWIKQWVQPFLRIATLATGRPQRLSWLTVSAAPMGVRAPERFEYPSGGLFGSGMEQLPYDAEYRDEWREAENRPLFTLANLPIPLPTVLARWVELEEGDNPFVELYGQTVRQPDLPRRARFLYLVQALEALHGHEHRDADAEAQEHFAAKRKEALAVLAVADLPDGTLSFIKKKWVKRVPDGLDRRLGELVAELPTSVQNTLAPPANDPVLVELVADEPLLQGQLRRLRNNLSHGTRNYTDSGLRPWVRAVEIMCRASALRLLGLSPDAVAAGIVPPSAPPPPASENNGSDEFTS